MEGPKTPGKNLALAVSLVNLLLHLFLFSNRAPTNREPSTPTPTPTTALLIAGSVCSSLGSTFFLYAEESVSTTTAFALVSTLSWTELATSKERNTRPPDRNILELLRVLK